MSSVSRFTFFTTCAVNSSGTAYGSTQTFTTAAPFTLAGNHFFNSAWSSTSSQTSPFTKYVEGWDVTGAASNATLVSISKINGAGTSTASACEGAASLRVQSSTANEQVTYVAVKANDQTNFQLKSVKLRYATRTAGTSFGTITLQGYKAGVSKPGAVLAKTGILPNTTTSNTYTLFDVAANNNFNDVDEFKVFASNPSSGALLLNIDMDELAIASATGTLPVVLKQIKAARNTNGVEVLWLTSAEHNLAAYEVETSTTGVSFALCGRVSARGTLNDATYKFIHTKAATGVNFYRLKMIDNDGSFAYSATVQVAATPNVTALKVLNNPVVNRSLQLKLTNVPGGNYHLLLTSMEGKQVFSKANIAARENTVLTLQLPNLLPGLYQVHITNENGDFSTRILIQ